MIMGLSLYIDVYNTLQINVILRTEAVIIIVSMLLMEHRYVPAEMATDWRKTANHVMVCRQTDNKICNSNPPKPWVCRDKNDVAVFVG